MTSDQVTSDHMHIIECPRDAMQGIAHPIPTELKVRYLNLLLKAGFDTLDFGSFVSPKAIPQMADTHEVIQALDLSQTNTQLLSIVANVRGAEDAVQYKQIRYIGYPFSVAETFQLRNTGATIEESLDRVKHIQSICLNNNKSLVVYLSMGFGNPYGDEWNETIVEKWVGVLAKMEIKTFALSDTIGVANPDTIFRLFDHLIPKYPDITIGAHFHTTKTSWKEKIDAALAGGCLRFDGAFGGYGGCPMAQNELVGNMPMENLFSHPLIDIPLDSQRLKEVQRINQEIFGNYH